MFVFVATNLWHVSLVTGLSIVFKISILFIQVRLLLTDSSPYKTLIDQLILIIRKANRKFCNNFSIKFFFFLIWIEVIVLDKPCRSCVYKNKYNEFVSIFCVFLLNSCPSKFAMVVVNQKWSLFTCLVIELSFMFYRVAPTVDTSPLQLEKRAASDLGLGHDLAFFCWTFRPRSWHFKNQSNFVFIFTLKKSI